MAKSCQVPVPVPVAVDCLAERVCPASDECSAEAAMRAVPGVEAWIQGSAESGRQTRWQRACADAVRACPWIYPPWAHVRTDI